MAGTLNLVQLIGRLTRDPDYRSLPNGGAVCNLALATNWYSRGADGKTQENTDYHDVVVYNQMTRKLADTCSRYLAKGRLVYIQGKLRTRSWDDAQGQRHWRTEVVANEVQFLERKPDGAPAGAPDAPPVQSGRPGVTWVQPEEVPL